MELSPEDLGQQPEDPSSPTLSQNEEIALNEEERASVRGLPLEDLKKFIHEFRHDKPKAKKRFPDLTAAQALPVFTEELRRRGIDP